MMSKLFLTIFAGLIIGYGSLHPARAQSYDKTLNTREPGASLKLFTENDKERFEVNTGFQIRYEIGGKTRTAFVWANKLSNLRIEKVRRGEQAVRVSAVTDDQALEIITHFIFDEGKQRVIIDRKIRNVSTKTVKVQMMSAYVEPELVVKGQSPDSNTDSGQAAFERIRAGRLIYRALKKRPNPEIDGYYEECNCDPPPQPCLTVRCKPGDKYILPRWYLLPGDKAVLQWDPFTIRPSRRAPAKAVLPVNEQQFVMVVNGKQ